MAQPANVDFSQFKMRVNIKSSPEHVYKAWATPAGLESWFLRQALFTDEKGAVRMPEGLLKVNDEYTFLMHGYPDSMSLKGKVLQANGKDLFSITFNEDYPVSISIYLEHDETIVELFESKLPTGEANVKKYYCSDSKGWVFYLTNLKSILEGGLDLRNKNEALKNVITA